MDGQDLDYRSMYTNLKRKFAIIQEEKDQTVMQLEEIKKQLKRLSKEKRFLLDKLIKFEEISSDEDNDVDSNSYKKTTTDRERERERDREREREREKEKEREREREKEKERERERDREKEREREREKEERREKDREREREKEREREREREKEKEKEERREREERKEREREERREREKEERREKDRDRDRDRDREDRREKRDKEKERDRDDRRDRDKEERREREREREREKEREREREKDRYLSDVDRSDRESTTSSHDKPKKTAGRLGGQMHTKPPSTPRSENERVPDKLKSPSLTPQMHSQQPNPPLPIPNEDLAGGSSAAGSGAVPRAEPQEGYCVAFGKDRWCKSKSLPNCKYCWHHAPLDPHSGFVWCQYVAKNKKKCNIPVQKSKQQPYCGYHQAKANGLTTDGTVAPDKDTSASEHETEPSSEKKQKRHKSSSDSNSANKDKIVTPDKDKENRDRSPNIESQDKQNRKQHSSSTTPSLISTPTSSKQTPDTSKSANDSPSSYNISSPLPPILNTISKTLTPPSSQQQQLSPSSSSSNGSSPQSADRLPSLKSINEEHRSKSPLIFKTDDNNSTIQLMSPTKHSSLSRSANLTSSASELEIDESGDNEKSLYSSPYSDDHK